MKFCIMTLGCKVNAYESELIKEQFKENGYIESDLNSDVDVITINTCSVTNQSDAKSRHLIRQARRASTNAILVVCGCSAQNHKEELQNLGIDILLGNKDKSKILTYVQNYQKKPLCKFYDMDNLEFEDMFLKSREDHTRAFVKIQDGCDNFCSYCIIPYLRGNKRSKDIDRAEEEIRTLVSCGHKEIVLTGIHTGSYGDKENYDLTDLIRRISAIKDLERIRISSIEITELDDKFLKELKNNPKLCNHMHIPLQSGSDKILKLMNRKYDTEYYRDKIAKIRSIRPDISITTDLIVGFPGEEDEDFKDTMKFLQEIKFTKIHTFPFSLRSGTKAEEMKNLFVQESTKKERVKEVLELSSKLESAYYKSFIGKTLPIIVEESNSEIQGHTSNYILVHTTGCAEVGSTMTVKITSVDGLVVNGVKQKVE